MHCSVVSQPSMVSTFLCVQVNQCLPDRVVVFRDGVGDGQISTVQGFEVSQIKEAFTMFGE